VSSDQVPRSRCVSASRGGEDQTAGRPCARGTSRGTKLSESRSTLALLVGVLEPTPPRPATTGRSHNPKVAGSNPAPATYEAPANAGVSSFSGVCAMEGAGTNRAPIGLVELGGRGSGRRESRRGNGGQYACPRRVRTFGHGVRMLSALVPPGLDSLPRASSDVLELSAQAPFEQLGGPPTSHRGCLFHADGGNTGCGRGPVSA